MERKTIGGGRKKQIKPLWIILIAVGVLILGVGAFFAIYLSNAKPPELTDPAGQTGEEETPNPLPPALADASRKENVYSFLVVGMDHPEHTKNTDVLMLCNFNSETGETNILQIPRDIYVNDTLMQGEGKLPFSETDASTTCKVNNIFNLAYLSYEAGHPGDSAGAYTYAMDYLCDKISALFCVPIDFHVSFNTQMYRDLLEIICPITVDVPFDMDYDDPSQDLHIHLKKGEQELNAEQAEGFSRFRKSNDGATDGMELAEGDFTRVDLQKIVLAKIAEKFFSTISLPRVQGFVGSVLNNVETDLKLENCLWFVTRAVDLYASGTMTLDSVRMYDLPCSIPSNATSAARGYTLSYGFMEKNLGYTLKILNRAYRLTDVEITAELLGYEEPYPIDYCDHSDTEGRSIQEILDNPPEVEFS